MGSRCQTFPESCRPIRVVSTNLEVGYTPYNTMETPTFPKRATRLLICPDCGKDGVIRSHCFNYAERVAKLLFVAPFRCQTCSHRFLAFSLGYDYLKDIIDRREHKRIPVRLALSFSGGRIRGTGMVRDISMGGCIIDCETIVQIDDIFYLQLFLGEQEMPVEVAAMVRSVSNKRIGFKFLRSAKENKRLFDFLHAKGA